MEKVQKIELEALKTAEHYELSHSILEFAEKCELITTELGGWLAPFRKAELEEERIFGISLRSDLTEPLSETDRERDGITTGSKAIANALLKNPSDEMRNAAREVMNQFISIGVNTSANYVEQTGQIDNLLNTLTASYSAQVELLGLTKPLQLLKDANDRMHELLNLRDVKQYGRMNGAMEKARTATDIAFRALIDAFNAYLLLNSAAVQANDRGAMLFITEANAKIAYFKRYALKGSSGKPQEVPGTDEGEGGEGGSEEEKKYRDLIFVVGEEEMERIRCEVGKAIPETDIPEAPEGMQWEGIPEVMPDEDVVVTAVPEENEDEDEDEELTPGMDWPSDVPAPEGWTIVKFVDKNGHETVKLYRNGSSVYSQGGYPENAPGYEWYGLHAILNGTTHTITEAEE